jgi:hypothetical protein
LKVGNFIYYNIKELVAIRFIFLGILIKKSITSSLDFQRPIRNWNYLHTLDDNFIFGFCKNRALNHKFRTECGRWQNINLFIYMYSKSRFLYVFRRIVKARKVDIAQCNCIVTLSIVIYVDNMYSQRNRPEMLTKDSHG